MDRWFGLAAVAEYLRVKRFAEIAMRKIATCVILGLFVVVVTSATGLSQSASALIGTWKLNPQKSQMVYNLPPKDLVRKYEDRGGGVYIFTQEGRAPDGMKMFSMYVAKEDGKEYPLVIQGADELGSILLKPVDAYTTEQTEKHGGNITSTATRTISRDGRTMTLTVKFRSFGGGPPENATDVMVFDKQ